MFELPEEDQEYLNALRKKWSLVPDSDVHLLIISDYELPEGYNHKLADLMIIIPSGYPTTELNMFYFCPEIQRQDNHPISTLTIENRIGRQWQRWSRHYEWEQGNGLVDHLEIVNHCLLKEVS